MVEVFMRKFAVPEHDGRGGIRVTYPDGRTETIPYMDGAVQLRGWIEAISGAGTYLAMTQRKPCGSG